MNFPGFRFFHIDFIFSHEMTVSAPKKCKNMFSLFDGLVSFLFSSLVFFLFQDVGIGRSIFSGMTWPGLFVRCVWLCKMPCLLLMARPLRAKSPIYPSEHCANRLGNDQGYNHHIMRTKPCPRILLQCLVLRFYGCPFPMSNHDPRFSSKNTKNNCP